MDYIDELDNLNDGTLIHCNIPLIWKDCIDHIDCYFAECDKCNFKLESDCKE